jgi:predicted SnoaL-like aldol condensation-catalyzing enzyme
LTDSRLRGNDGQGKSRFLTIRHECSRLGLPNRTDSEKWLPQKKDQIRALLKSIETGDPGPVAVVNEAKYIQHNPQTQEGSEGLAALFKRLSETSPRVNIVRAFEDGDFVFGHTEYDFASRRIGFEVFRFEDGQAVEHWDNIQARLGPNEAGRSMVDGPVDAVDLGQTESNRTLVRSFVEAVLIGGQLDRLSEFVADDFAEHNPRLTDGASALRAALGAGDIDYHKIHRVLAEGNFVLCVSEGEIGGIHSAFYDLFRVAGARLAEHWDTTEKIAPQSEWINDNGKF